MKTTLSIIAIGFALTSCTIGAKHQETPAESYATMSLDDLQVAQSLQDTAPAMNVYYRLKSTEYSNKSDSCTNVYFNHHWKGK